MPLITAVIIVIVAVLVTALIVWNVAVSYRKKSLNPRLFAEEKAREFIDEA